MTEESESPAARLSPGFALALELDMVLAALNDYYPSGSLAPDMAALVEPAASAWQAEWGGLLAEPGRSVDLLEVLAVLAGALFEEDYEQATRPLRELTVEGALARLEARSNGESFTGQDRAAQPNVELFTTGQERAAMESRPTAARPTTESVEAGGGPGTAAAETLVRLAAAGQRDLFEGLGFLPQYAVPQAQRYERELRRAVRVLRGGDLHDRFWSWLDHFYYERYAPWRSGQAAALAQAVENVRLALGAGSGAGAGAGIGPGGGLPDLTWLPAQSPLLRMPELRGAFLDGRLAVTFWIEPFGLSDSWTLLAPAHGGGLPRLVMSCARPGRLYEDFQARAIDVAARAAALGDPTRLIILRLIRHFGMINTEIAEFLGLARPTVSIHAKILREAGLIHSQQEGRQVRHEIDPAEVRRLFRDLERFLDLPEDTP